MWATFFAVVSLKLPYSHQMVWSFNRPHSPCKLVLFSLIIILKLCWDSCGIFTALACLVPGGRCLWGGVLVCADESLFTTWPPKTKNYIVLALHFCNKSIFDDVWFSGIQDAKYNYSEWAQTKDYKIRICCFSAMHTALRRKSKFKDWWLEIRIMCQSEATCLSADCCFSRQVSLYKY
jgi:hypothetical protein